MSLVSLALRHSCRPRFSRPVRMYLEWPFSTSKRPSFGRRCNSFLRILQPPLRRTADLRLANDEESASAGAYLSLYKTDILNSSFLLSTRAGSLAGVNMGNARTNKGLLQLRIKSCLAIPFLPRSVKNLGQKPRTNLHILSCGCLQSEPTLSQRPPPSSSSSLLVQKVPLARGCHFHPPRDSSLVSDPLRLGGSA